MRRNAASRLFVENVLPESRPCRFEGQNVVHFESIATDGETQSFTAFFNPIVPFRLAPVPLFLFIQDRQQLLVATHAKPHTIHARVLKNRSYVVQAVHHVTDQRQNYNAVGVAPVTISLTPLVGV